MVCHTGRDGGTGLLPAHAQVGVAWSRTPSITVVANGDDPRIELVRNAIAYWNTALADIDSGFRLGPVTVVDTPIPEEALQQRSQAILGGTAGTAPSIASLRFPITPEEQQALRAMYPVEWKQTPAVPG